jgi:hypothetical protein
MSYYEQPGMLSMVIYLLSILFGWISQASMTKPTRETRGGLTLGTSVYAEQHSSMTGVTLSSLHSLLTVSLPLTSLRAQ